MTHYRCLFLLGATLFAFSANAQLYSPFTMHEGLNIAYDVARGWHGGDVDLIFLHANYVKELNEQIDLSTGESYNWVYNFYDHSCDTSILVLVRKFTAGGYFSPVLPSYYPITQAELDLMKIARYIVAPDSAIQTMRNSGLREFTNAHPDYITQVFEGRGLNKLWRGIFVSGNDSLICKVDLFTGQSYGCTESTISGIRGIGDKQEAELYPVSPNPVSLRRDPELLITYGTTSPSIADLNIFDINGRQVVTLGGIAVHPGTNIIRVPTNKLGIPGSYFAVLKMQDHISSQKIIVID